MTSERQVAANRENAKKTKGGGTFKRSLWVLRAKHPQPSLRYG